MSDIFTLLLPILHYVGSNVSFHTLFWIALILFPRALSFRAQT